MHDTAKATQSKVPEVTLIFWLIKIAATSLGETGGDSVTMTLHWGYLAGSALFLAALAVLVAWQIAAGKFHPFLYWATIIASTTFGTTMADFADRSLGIGYAGGSAVLLACLLAVLGLWHWSRGTISVDTVATPKVEVYYWAAITFSQTLGTALGDWTAEFDRPRLRIQRAGLRRRSRGRRRRLRLDRRIARAAVLDRLHPDSATGRNGRRLSRQARAPWWARAQPSGRLGGDCRVYPGLSADPAATRRQTSGAIARDRLSASAPPPSGTASAPSDLVKHKGL